MNSAKELAFLLELRFLTDAAQAYAERITALASQWTATHDNLRKPRPKPRPRFSLANPDDYFQQMVQAENDRTRTIQQLLNQSINAQGELFALVDAFLSLYGRIALILFPHPDKKQPAKEARAKELRMAIQIGDAHPFSHKVLRNKWVHFDEILDQAEDDLSPQRFIHSGQDSELHRQSTLRLVIVDTRTIIYQGFGEYKLDEMFASVDDIRTRTLNAIETWGERWREELLADD